MNEEQKGEDARASALRITDVDLHDIGQHLIDLGELLIATGGHADNGALRASLEAAEHVGSIEAYEHVERERVAALRRTLMGLKSFRRDYYDWERLIVEYALRGGFTQREVASLLGVGLSTVNRWAQHPLAYGED